MSSALAIAATTKVLAHLIDDAVASAGLSGILQAATTSAVAPDRVITGENEVAHLNLFLYQVSWNQGWRNNDQPSRDSQGNLVTRPVLALDLHYLLTAYGEAEFQPEILLGLGMQALHEHPVLERDRIRSVFTPPPPPDTLPHQIMIELASAELADQIEMIRIVPETVSVEELYKLWTAFQAKYRPSAAYHASVVLIESRGAIRSALPVRARRVYSLPFRRPVIDLVEEPLLPFTAGVKLHLRGQNLLLNNSVVRFASGQETTPDSGTSLDSRLTITLPALNAGLNAVQVIQRLVIGDPPPRTVIESNVVPFSLQPVLKNITYNAAGPTITLKVDPPLQKAQKADLLLDAGSVAVDSYQFSGPVISAPTDTVVFGVPGISAGAYFVRIRVDGADSPLDIDPTGKYAGPLVLI